jgi:leucyl aminopeptidase
MKTIVFIFLAVLLTVNCSTSEQKRAGQRLIEFADGTQKWLSRSQIEYISARPGRKNDWIDVTDSPTAVAVQSSLDLPKEPKQQAIVKPLLPKLEASRIKETVDRLSNDFANRKFRSELGVKAAHWLHSQYEKLIDSLPEKRKKLFSVEFFNHTFPQPSIIIRINGSDSALREQIVILGGHIDSTAGGDRAPGADDDGSGSSCVFETFRVFSQSDFVPKRTIEFHGYAGEEGGLLGSADIARKYKAANKKVFGMMQLDMTAWNAQQGKIGVVRTQTDPTLSAFVKTLIKEYTNNQFGDTGVCCSDQQSWFRQGYPAAFPFEVPVGLNPNIHTTRDTLDILDFNHAVQFSKIALGFVIEMSEHIN